VARGWLRGLRRVELVWGGRRTRQPVVGHRTGANGAGLVTGATGAGLAIVEYLPTRHSYLTPRAPMAVGRVPGQHGQPTPIAPIAAARGTVAVGVPAGRQVETHRERSEVDGRAGQGFV